MPIVDAFQGLDPLAVLVAAVAHMLTGLVWFHARLFGPTWSALTGQELKPAFRWVPAAALGHLAIAVVLGIIVRLAGATTVPGGMAVGALVWLGFVVTLETGELVWEKIPLGLFGLRIGNHLVALALAGAILAVWR